MKMIENLLDIPIFQGNAAVNYTDREICALCSFFDQVHKIYVPDREFDTVDLYYDAAGYVAAVGIITVICLMVLKRKKMM